MDAEELRDRFRGALLGTAVGDALGAPFEGWPRVDADQLAAWEASTDPLRWTDDTHMTIGVAESLVAADGFDADHMAQRFRANHDAEPWRGYGAGPPMIFAAMRKGTDWRDAARGLFGGTGSFGNGAAMRSAPIGLHARGDLDRAVAIAREAAGITHAHELGRQGAAAQACAVGWLSTIDAGADSWAGERLLDHLRRVAPDQGFAERFDAIGRLSPEASAGEVAGALGNGIAAIDSVPAALYAALRHRRSFEETVRFAVTLGGDADTIAAMAGALSGALLGYSAIPRAWVDRLEAADALTRLADQLLAAAPGP